jgi:hypothetical protein
MPDPTTGSVLGSAPDDRGDTEITTIPRKVAAAPRKSRTVIGSPSMSADDASPTTGTARKPIVAANGLSDREIDWLSQ